MVQWSKPCLLSARSLAWFIIINPTQKWRCNPISTGSLSGQLSIFGQSCMSELRASSLDFKSRPSPLRLLDVRVIHVGQVTYNCSLRGSLVDRWNGHAFVHTDSRGHASVRTGDGSYNVHIHANHVIVAVELLDVSTGRLNPDCGISRGPPQYRMKRVDKLKHFARISKVVGIPI